MGKKQYPAGVQVRGERVRIWFPWEGKKKNWETIPGKPNAETIQRAGKIRSEIIDLISLGVFDVDAYQRYFPNTDKIQNAIKSYRFFENAQRYLDTLEVGKTTKDEYRRSLNGYWIPWFAKFDVRAIKVSQIKEAIVNQEFKTEKTRANALIPLRGVFNMLVKDNIIAYDANPMAHIEHRKPQKTKPDPLDGLEIQAVLATLKESYHPFYLNYFTVALFSGLRNPSELGGLHWKDVDFIHGTIHVHQKIVGGQLVGKTKTHNPRFVHLPTEAMEALKAMKAYTFLENDFVFKSPAGNPLFTPNKTVNPAWRSVLKKAGVRHRDMRQTRHTAATQWIMAGLNPKFVADQLGDRLETIMNHYAVWINAQGTTAEMEKLKAWNAKNNLKGSKSVPNES